MAFCVKCGAKLEEGAKFCTACAFPVDGSAPVNTETPEAATASVAAKPLNKKLIGIIAGAAAALVVALILIFVLLPGGADHSSPEAVAEAFVEAYFGGDVGTAYDCYPDFYLEYIADQMGCEVSDLKGIMADNLAALMEDVEFKIKKVKVDEETDDLDDIPSRIQNRMSKADEKAFEGYAEVTIKMEFDGSDTTRYISCICLDGKWYVLE